MKLSLHSDRAQSTLDGPELYLGAPDKYDVGPDTTHSAIPGDVLTVKVWNRPNGRIELRKFYGTTQPDIDVREIDSLSVYEGDGREPSQSITRRRENGQLLSFDITMKVEDRWLIWHQDFTKPHATLHDFGYFEEADRYNRLSDSSGDDFLPHLETWHPLGSPRLIVEPPTSKSASALASAQRSTTVVAEPKKVFGIPLRQHTTPSGS